MDNHSLSPEELAILRMFAQRPKLVIRLLEFSENMEAAGRASKWIAWVAGVLTAIAGFLFYLMGIIHGAKNG